MPELPEVQTVVTDLNRKIKGDTIVDFWSDAPNSLKEITVEKFKKGISGRKILGVRRIGKNIFIDLSGGKTLYVHLKMTGHLLVKYQVSSSKYKVGGADYFEDKVNQYIHHIWKLKSGRTLEFSDLRKFAKIVLLDTDKVETYKDIVNLGIDAMSPEFTLKKFVDILDRKPKQPIGILLMDQNVIAGIGNIYRSEILFESNVLPERKVADLSDQERKDIFLNIKQVLKKAIKYRGTSDSDYRDTDGAPGGFQKIMKVYNQEGEKCKKCGTIITRRKLAQRSVFFCSECQI